MKCPKTPNLRWTHEQTDPTGGPSRAGQGVRSQPHVRQAAHPSGPSVCADAVMMAMMNWWWSTDDGPVIINRDRTSAEAVPFASSMQVEPGGGGTHVTRTWGPRTGRNGIGGEGTLLTGYAASSCLDFAFCFRRGENLNDCWFVENLCNLCGDTYAACLLTRRKGIMGVYTRKFMMRLRWEFDF